MKVGIAALLCAIAGVVFGVGYNAYTFGWAGNPKPALLKDLPEPRPVSSQSTSNLTNTKSRPPVKPAGNHLPLPPANGPQPKAVAPGMNFEFGTMMAGDDGLHEFEIKNEGEYPLELAPGKTSCKCTISKLPVKKLAPGESTKVTVTWKTSIAKSGKFRQTARVLTNDPKQQTLTFTISGEITVLLRSVPSYLSMGTLTPRDSKTAEFKLFSHHLIIAQLEVEGFDFENLETAKYFDVAFEPLPTDQLDKDATSGVLGKITLKGDEAGLPTTGPNGIRQTLHVRTNVREVKSIPVTIGGSIVKEIDILCLGWNSTREMLDFGVLRKDIATKRLLNFWVRGPEWKNVDVELASVAPDWIKVVQKSSRDLDNTNTRHIVYEITIAKDAKTTDLVGENLGHLKFQTTHSEMKQIDIPIRIGPPEAVEPVIIEEPAKEAPAKKEPAQESAKEKASGAEKPTTKEEPAAESAETKEAAKEEAAATQPD